MRIIALIRILVTMKPRQRISNQRGTTAVEFGIILPLLIVLLFGIVEFSLILYDKAMITNASREGARAGMVYVRNENGGQNNRLSDDAIINVVNSYCSDHLVSFGSGSLQVPPPEDITGPSGDALRVRVTYTYDFLVLPNFVDTLTGGITMSAETVMRKEHQS